MTSRAPRRPSPCAIRRFFAAVSAMKAVAFRILASCALAVGARGGPTPVAQSGIGSIPMPLIARAKGGSASCSRHGGWSRSRSRGLGLETIRATTDIVTRLPSWALFGASGVLLLPIGSILF